MKNKTTNPFFYSSLILFFFLISPSLFAQQNPEVYSEIKIELTSPDLLSQLAAEGFPIDHFHKSEENHNHIEVVFSQQELQKLELLNVDFEIIIPNVAEHFLQENSENITETTTAACGLEHFDIGDMGGYHTYDNMIDHIQMMEAEFPDLVKINTIGTTIEGRSIYSVKISDNVLLDESNEEGVVYYDALTHAREPMSLEAILYYMWWLLENHDVDAEATYLVDHREIYFVPIVNPDGYVYNQTTNPNGGGLWRKNRRDNGGNCFGVDLNRNYSYQWGLNSGSSSDGCSNTYRGTEPFSEPESEAVKNITTQIQPSIAFSVHTYGDVFLSPFGYADTLAEYDTYAEFTSEFVPKYYKGYGTTSQMLGYTSSGTTRDYLHSQGIYRWTPEIGHAFWEPSTVICDRVQEFLKPMKYLSWVSGNYACYHDFKLINPGKTLIGDTIKLEVRIKNRGLTKDAENVEILLESLHPSLTSLEDSKNLGTISPRTFANNSLSPFLFTVNDNIPFEEILNFKVTVKQDNNISYQDTFYINSGSREVLFSDDAEINSSNWFGNGNQIWDTCYMDAVSGDYSFADSRYGNYIQNSLSYFTLNQVFDFTDLENPWVEFNAKWSLERMSDYCYFEASSDGGLNWFSLEGRYTLPDNNDHRYNYNQHWIQERIDLSSLSGFDNVQFRFKLTTDNSINCDGFYFDDFRVLNLTESPMVSTDNPISVINSFKVFPNPSFGKINLSWKSTKSENNQIQIFDVFGKIIFEENIVSTLGENLQQIELKGYSTGIYFLKFHSGKNYHYEKLIIE
ncbi:MAG: M14 family zinc carboxypeptidase [Saprospiraceae bacterium]